MKLITKELEGKLPRLGATDGKPAEEVMVHVKLFNPTGAGTWYLVEYSPEERVAYGLCEVLEPELGYVSLDELERFRSRFGGLGIERDLYWRARSLAEVMRQVAGGSEGGDEPGDDGWDSCDDRPIEETAHEVLSQIVCG